MMGARKGNSHVGCGVRIVREVPVPHTFAANIPTGQGSMNPGSVRSPTKSPESCPTCRTRGDGTGGAGRVICPSPSPTPDPSEFAMRHHAKTRLALQPLEGRDLMSVTSVTLTAGTLQVTADNAADNIEIRQVIHGHGSSVTVSDKTSPTNASWSFNAGSVQRIVVKTNGGNDRVDSTAAKPTTVWGGDGNDLILTGNGSDSLYGGAGNDSVYGGAGNDRIYGDAGV